jgi:hypothetical protein
VFRLAYRQAEGLIGSIVDLLGLTLRVPDHTTLRAYPSRQFGDQPPPMTGGSEEDENEAAGPRRWMAAAG